MQYRPTPIFTQRNLLTLWTRQMGAMGLSLHTVGLGLYFVMRSHVCRLYATGPQPIM